MKYPKIQISITPVISKFSITRITSRLASLCLVIWTLVIGNYLGFDDWDLEFYEWF
jgi:hypothetical protein